MYKSLTVDIRRDTDFLYTEYTNKLKREIMKFDEE